MKQRSLVYNTVQASGADVALADGVMTLNNPADSTTTFRVIVNKIIRRVRRAVTTAVAQVSSAALVAQVPLVASQMYTLELTFPKVNVGIDPEAPQSYTKKYSWFSGVAAPTAAELVAAIAAAVQADQTRKVNATVSTNTLTLTQITSAEGRFSATLNGFMIPVTTANVLATGSKAYVDSILGPNNAATPGASYIHFEIVDTEQEDPSSLSGVATKREVERVNHIFINAAATNSGSLDTAIVAILDGTATAANFLGAVPPGTVV